MCGLCEEGVFCGRHDGCVERLDRDPFYMDWRELEQEGWERDLSTHDFETPFKGAA